MLWPAWASSAWDCLRLFRAGFSIVLSHRLPTSIAARIVAFLPLFPPGLGYLALAEGRWFILGKGVSGPVSSRLPR